LTISVSRVILRPWSGIAMRIKTEVVQAGSEDALHHAAEALEAGGLIAFPTDTVYGVAALPWDVDAVARLYVAKQRPRNLPIPLLLSDADQLYRVATLAPKLTPLAEHFWPGGLTLVLPKTEIVPDVVSPGATVAVRVPDLALARNLIRRAGGVLAVTSANISGQPSPVTAKEVEEQLGGRIDLIVDGGPCREGVPSSLLDCTVSPPALLRRGAISEESLRAVAGSITTS
jgi:L-threonylcarbamoyladenylate synthase